MMINEHACKLLFDEKHKLPCVPITRAQFCVSDLAQWLAGERDEVQAAFFNEFDIQLRRLCDISGRSHVMQLAYANKYLSVDAKFTLTDLGQ